MVNALAICIFGWLRQSSEISKVPELIVSRAIHCFPLDIVGHILENSETHT